MSTMSLAPETRFTDEDESYGFITEFDLPTGLGDESASDADRERIRYDEQILAALVSP